MFGEFAKTAKDCDANRWQARRKAAKLPDMATRIRPDREEGLTRELAGFVAGADARSIPPEALNAARRAVIDTAGVILAGRREEAAMLLASTLADGDDALPLAGGRRLRAGDAALLDGVAGHVLDYDDVAQHGHPSVVIVPALLAEGQRIGAPGTALLRAYVIGYECWAELARRECDAYHLGSWHPTPMLGIVAATAALCALHGASQDCASHAMAFAASFASGVIANFGTHAKSLHAGRAAAGAIETVRLARAGMTAASDALEGEHGLLRGISPHGRVDCASPLAAGRGEWAIVENGPSVKRYPVCYASHRAIDAVLAIREEAGLRPEQVAAITVSLGPAPAATLCYAHPADGLQARFSLHHNLAAALIDGAVGFEQLSDGYVRRPDVQALYGATCIVTVEGNCPDQPGMAECDRVVIETRDGRRLDSGPVRYPRGHFRLPLTDAELDAKFLDCASHSGVKEPQALRARLHGLGEITDLRELAA